MKRKLLQDTEGLRFLFYAFCTAYIYVYLPLATGNTIDPFMYSIIHDVASCQNEHHDYVTATYM